MSKKVRQRFKVLAANVQGKVEKAKRAAALEILKNVIFLTPVDTGRARANWFVGIGSPNRTNKNVDPKANKNRGFPGSLSSEQNKILRAVPFTDIFISNNVEYIQRLNEGSSEQAAAGFVQRAIQSGVNTIRKIF